MYTLLLWGSGGLRSAQPSLAAMETWCVRTLHHPQRPTLRPPLPCSAIPDPALRRRAHGFFSAYKHASNYSDP